MSINKGVEGSTTKILPGNQWIYICLLNFIKLIYIVYGTIQPVDLGIFSTVLRTLDNINKSLIVQKKKNYSIELNQ